MTWNELKKRIFAEYDSRKLKSTARYNAIDKIENFIQQHYPQAIEEVKEIMTINKQQLKEQYTKQKGKNISGAESSAINEIYKQLSYPFISINNLSV